MNIRKLRHCLVANVSNCARACIVYCLSLLSTFRLSISSNVFSVIVYYLLLTIFGVITYFIPDVWWYRYLFAFAVGGISVVICKYLADGYL